MIRTRTRLAALAVLAAGALSACGSLHPGVAAEVGDQSITGPRVEKLSRDLCSVVKIQPSFKGQTIPRSTLLNSVVQSWVQRSIADQLADEYGVKPTSSYYSTVDQAKTQLASLDAGLRDQVLDTITAASYFADIMGQVGRAEAAGKGESEPTAQVALSSGVSIAQAWLEDHEIQIDPRYPTLGLGDDSFEVGTDQTSYAVSSYAKQALASEPAQEFVDSLPASQVCAG